VTLVYGVGLEPHRLVIRHKGKDQVHKFSADDESEDSIREVCKNIAKSIARDKHEQ
jgi:hypothetical protein